MIGTILNRIHEAERRFARSFGTDISTPAKRAQAWVHFHLFDHGVLRGLWTNFFQVAPGVWRSNQPSPRRLRRYHELGIRTILNLRGVDKFSFYLFEKETAEKLGMEMINIKIYARSLGAPETYLALLDIFETIDKPFVLHCKSGADRAGLASALWLLHMEQRPVAEAQKQLSLRYAHLKNTRTGILDQLLECYAEDIRETPMPIREWIETRYDRDRVEAAFARKQGRAA